MLKTFSEMDYKMLNYYLRGYIDAKIAPNNNLVLSASKRVAVVSVVPFTIRSAEEYEKSRLSALPCLVNGKSHDLKIKNKNTYQDIFYDSLQELTLLGMEEKMSVYNSLLNAVGNSAYFAARGLNTNSLTVEEKFMEAETELCGLDERFAEFASPILRAKYLQCNDYADELTE